jgi:hypothetical protein
VPWLLLLFWRLLALETRQRAAGGKSQWEKSNLGQLMRQGCYMPR